MNNLSRQGSTASRIIVTEKGPIVVSPADTILRKLRLGTSPRRVFEIAHAAIALDPTYPRAYLIAGESITDRELKLAYFSDAVRLGNALWQPYAASHRVKWWDEVGTQDFLISIFNKGRILFELGYEAKARLHFELLNALDPADHLGGGDYFDNLQTGSETAKYIEPNGPRSIQEEQPRFIMQ